MFVVKIIGQIGPGASFFGSCCKGLSNFVLYTYPQKGRGDHERQILCCFENQFFHRFQRHSWNINMALLKQVLSSEW